MSTSHLNMMMISYFQVTDNGVGMSTDKLQSCLGINNYNMVEGENFALKLL